MHILFLLFMRKLEQKCIRDGQQLEIGQAAGNACNAARRSFESSSKKDIVPCNGPLLPKPLSDDKLSYADFVISLVLLWRKHHSFESHSTLYQDQALHLLHYPTLGSPLCNDHATLVNLSATNFMNYSAETSKDMAACTRDMILKLELFYRPRHASELTNLFGSKSHNG
jgi:hypothetical protein